MNTIRIGYLGPGKGTFGFQAAQKFFKNKRKSFGRKRVEFIPFANHTAIVTAVGSMELSFGVVAIENSTDGIISQTVRAMAEIKVHYGVAIFAEVVLPIQLFPLRKKGFLGLPKKIISHASPLQQAGFYVSLMQKQGVLVDPVESTEFAVKEASLDDSVCAIASKFAGELYGLVPMTNKSIEDEKSNKTRFWVIGKSYNAIRTEHSKTAFLCFLDRSTPGGLAETFRSFAEVNPPLTIAITYPIPLPGRNWEYVFLIEVHGYITDSNMLDAWKRLRNGNFYLTPPLCLGSYSAEAL